MLIALQAACGNPLVLSTYGSMRAVSDNPDKSPRFRDAPHDGVDVALSSPGDLVVASADGIVDAVSELSDASVQVSVCHDRFPLPMGSEGPFYVTDYGHLRTSTVRVGDRVSRG